MSSAEMEIVEDHKALLDRIASENGFTDYELLASSGSNKGDNFTGILTAVTIKNKEKSLDLILKSSRKNMSSKEAKDSHINVNKREILLYERVFKEFQKFQEEHNIQDPFESVPKYYSSFTEEGHDSLVLENLKTQQYELWNKKIAMNPGHIKAVLIEYAKFHAVSLAMKQKNPELFNALAETNLDNPMEKPSEGNEKNQEKFKSFFTATLSLGYKAVKDDIALTESLKKYEGIALENIFKSRQPEYKLVVTHGDCWCNNFMFKYQDPKDKTEPQSLRVIDWQMSSFGSPCGDLSYFLVANASEEVLDDLQTYLHVYHDKLSSQLRDFNLDPEEVFPFSKFENHFKLFMSYSLFLALLITKVTLSDADEIPEHKEEAEKKKSEELLVLLASQIKNFEEYTRRIKIIINFLVKNKYL
ncbi:uncharacterized protein [Diabrotica undecimpunctata]|uniref:uncharacterized protein isoform X1 n=1 Tax=Diabrotica undecimpunctata TaxID=50387 RepID=UPI003B63B977